MSYDNDMLVWVGDLDSYINIDAISRENELQSRQDALEVELECLGEIELFSNSTTSSRLLHSRGVSPEQWRWMIHRAEKSLGQALTNAEIEAAFLKIIMSMARRYAVARYAHFEGLSFSSAITATFPHGIRALLFNYLVGEQSLSDPSCRKEIQRTLRLAVSTPNLTSYDQTGLVRHSLHKLATDAAGENAHLKLDKDAMRDILSLTRLYFLNLESQIQSVAELREMHLRYESARAAEELGFDTTQKITGRRIKNWRLRFLHPFTFFFPFAVRRSLKRLIIQDAKFKTAIERLIVANEIALVYCEMELMRRRSIEKAKVSE